MVDIGWNDIARLTAVDQGAMLRLAMDVHKFAMSLDVAMVVLNAVLPGTNRLVCSPDIFLTNAKSYNNILFNLAGSEGSPCVIFNQMRGFFRWAASLVRVQWWHPPQSRGQHEAIPQPNPSVHPWKSAQDCHTVILAAANTGWAQLVQVRLVCAGGASGLVARQLWCLTVCSLLWKAIWVFIQHFPISEIIFRYREFEFPISGNNSRYREMISRYREFEFRISGNMELFSDIGNSISRYQEIIPDIEKWISFSNI